MAIEVQADESIVCASRIVINLGCKPSRIVLRRVEGGHPFVVHMQTLQLATGDHEPYWAHDGFHNGHYFKADDENQAREDFHERARKL